MIDLHNKINWCIKKHQETNHFYDKYLPYEFHLRMVNQVAKDFIYLLPKHYFTFNFQNKLLSLYSYKDNEKQKLNYMININF